MEQKTGMRSLRPAIEVPLIGVARDSPTHPLTLARAIAALGRIPKTLYMLSYIDDEHYRRRILTQLHPGEGRHSVARAVFMADGEHCGCGIAKGKGINSGLWDWSSMPPCCGTPSTCEFIPIKSSAARV
jgi:hypothetical protein